MEDESNSTLNEGSHSLVVSSLYPSLENEFA
jgi:hypothetical protein